MYMYYDICMYVCIRYRNTHLFHIVFSKGVPSFISIFSQLSVSLSLDLSSGSHVCSPQPQQLSTTKMTTVIAMAMATATVMMMMGSLAQGMIECEELGVGECAFAIASSGARCFLHKHINKNARFQYTCQVLLFLVTINNITLSLCLNVFFTWYHITPCGMTLSPLPPGYVLHIVVSINNIRKFSCVQGIM